MSKRAYEYHHVVGFEETNLLGNVYYVNHVRWQGRCRELFLREHAPDVLNALSKNLRLVTTRCSCDYHAELAAFDQVTIRMRLGEMAQNRLTLLFEYIVRKNEATQPHAPEELVATGEQQVACMREENGKLVPAPIPESLIEALRPYG